MGTLSSILKSLYPSAPQQSFEASVADFLKEANVPQELADDLCDKSYSEQLSVGPIAVFPINEVHELNLDDVYAPWFNDGYLTIAETLDGDPVAVDLQTMKMVFILQDQMDLDQSGMSASEFVIHTPLTYDEFWTTARDEKGFPGDSIAAEKRWGRSGRS